MSQKLVTYRDYIRVDDLLSLQGGEAGGGIHYHEEHLFIVVHQAFELWFKQILFELESIVTLFSGFVSENENQSSASVSLSSLSETASVAVARLSRCDQILRMTLGHFQVLETMHPCQFHEFRNFIGPASGFQSQQMREMEILLGIRDYERYMSGKHVYSEIFEEDQRERLVRLLNGPNLKNIVQDVLSRHVQVPTKFLEVLREEKRKNLIEQKMVWFGEEHREQIEEQVNKEMQTFDDLLEGSDIGKEQYGSRFPNVPHACRMNADLTLSSKNSSSTSSGCPAHNTEIASPQVSEEEKQNRCRARVAALFVQTYRNDEKLRNLSELLDMCLAFEETVLLWRTYHARMVERMIGRRVGTGGSSGVDYLDATTTYRVFTDLWAVRTILLQSSAAPSLESIQTLSE